MNDGNDHDIPARAAIRRWLATSNARVHMMGTGGIGMAGVARLLATTGQRVDGCDSASPRTLAWLRQCGIETVTGHHPRHLEGVDWAVFSPALGEEHPERMEAVRRGIPLFRRGHVLAALAERWKTLAVAGTHGKTTTSSMATHILRACGADPAWCVGGELPPAGAPAGAGKGHWLVIEADESDGTLAEYAPAVAVVNNVEYDHMEHFAGPEAMRECFREFLRRTTETALGCAEDPVAAKLVTEAGGTLFGISATAAWRAEDIRLDTGGARFQIRSPNGACASVRLPLPGLHNVLNATGAVAATVSTGCVGLEAACRALAAYALPRRRLEMVAEGRGIRVVADYAHHPSEIRALLSAVRQAGAARVLAVFQPHRHTRTKALGGLFPAAFEGVDELVLTPVYAASEAPLAGGMASDLLAEFRRQGNQRVELADSLTDAAARIMACWRPGDWILLVGAGDIETLGPILKTRLNES